MESPKTPLYEQVRQEIFSLIQKRYLPGDLLPTQQELSKELGASLITIKHALRKLAQDQIIESVRGRGTIVKGKNITDRRQGVSSWTDSVTGLGENPETAWTVLKRHLPDDRIRHLLNLKSREYIVTVERLRLVEGKPICLMRNCLPAARVPGLEDKGLSGESLYRCLSESYGIHLKRSNETVRARASSHKEKKQLGSDASIVLEIDRITEDTDGKLAEWAQIIAHADRYTYQIQLINP